MVWKCKAKISIRRHLLCFLIKISKEEIFCFDWRQFPNFFKPGGQNISKYFEKHNLLITFRGTHFGNHCITIIFLSHIKPMSLYYLMRIIGHRCGRERGWRRRGRAEHGWRGYYSDLRHGDRRQICASDNVTIFATTLCKLKKARTFLFLRFSDEKKTKNISESIYIARPGNSDTGRFGIRLSTCFSGF